LEVVTVTVLVVLRSRYGRMRRSWQICD